MLNTRVKVSGERNDLEYEINATGDIAEKNT